MSQLTDRQYRAVVRVARDRIVNYPATHDQYDWLVIDPDFGGLEVLNEDCDVVLEIPYDEEELAFDDSVGDLVTVGTDVDLWDRCGTTACVAGHLVAAGLELGYLDQDEMVSGFVDILDAAEILVGGRRPSDLYGEGTSRGFILEWMNRVVGDEVTS